MVSKIHQAVAGAKAKASQFNEGVAQPLSNMDSADNTTTSLTRTSDGTTAYTTVRTLSVDANAVDKFIIVRFDMDAIADSAGGNLPTVNNTSVKAQITIDSTQQFETETLTASANNQSGDPTIYIERGIRNFVFKYEPSASEKTNGFTIDLDLELTLSLSGTGTNSGQGRALNYYWEVWGA